MCKTISKDAMVILEQCDIKDGTVFLPAGQLERPLYDKVNKVLVGLGGKWNRKAKGHVFPDNPVDAIEDAMLTGTYTRLKDDLQYFPTPDAVIDEMLDGLTIVGRVLEPSAGEGAIVNRLLGDHRQVFCCEQHEPFREKLAAIDGVTVLPTTNFLEVDEMFDLIVANPPFTKQQDIVHVAHMIDLLLKGGKLVTVMSNGITFRETNKTLALQDKLMEECPNFEITPLPEGSFKSSGTGVNTVLLTATKI